MIGLKTLIAFGIELGRRLIAICFIGSKGRLVLIATLIITTLAIHLAKSQTLGTMTANSATLDASRAVDLIRFSASLVMILITGSKIEELCAQKPVEMGNSLDITNAMMGIQFGMMGALMTATTSQASTAFPALHSHRQFAVNDAEMVDESICNAMMGTLFQEMGAVLLVTSKKDMLVLVGVGTLWMSVLKHVVMGLI